MDGKMCSIASKCCTDPCTGQRWKGKLHVTPLTSPSPQKCHKLRDGLDLSEVSLFHVVLFWEESTVLDAFVKSWSEIHQMTLNGGTCISCWCPWYLFYFSAFIAQKFAFMLMCCVGVFFAMLISKHNISKDLGSHSTGNRHSSWQLLLVHPCADSGINVFNLVSHQNVWLHFMFSKLQLLCFQF